MKFKIISISVILSVLLVLTIIPAISSKVSKVATKDSLLDNSKILNTNKKQGNVKINVYHIKEDGTYDKSTKELTYDQQNALWEELKSIEFQGYTISQVFEKKLQILKDYGVVSYDLELSQVLDVKKLEAKYEKVDGENFEADYAPILFAGGGIGFGFGIPFFITSGTFLMLLFGFGITLCLDIINGILYQLLTFFFIPMLIGYLGGFIGLLLLPVIPGFFYSNAFGLGMATKTSWMLVPSTNYSAV